MDKILEKYSYIWPDFGIQNSSQWQKIEGKRLLKRELPEEVSVLRQQSRWPALFPSAMCLVTTADGSIVALEKVVAPVIVNRFPYVMSLSFCVMDLSDRHYSRKKFLEILERGGSVAVQFVAPGESLNKIMDMIASVGDQDAHKRLDLTGLSTRRAVSSDVPVFTDAYLVYEGRLVKENQDMEGQTIYQKPYVDIGSHRIYFFEINVIQLREDIAQGRNQITWRSLPAWTPQFEVSSPQGISIEEINDGKYKKGYNPHYRFPSKNTIAFVSDCIENGMAIKKMSSEIVIDNNDSRWPCFFPSSVGLISSFLEDGTPNLMPCGSTAVVGRLPFIIGICVGYAAINERYKPRFSLEVIRRSGQFGCGVPFLNDKIIQAITYAGNRSIADDRQKLFNAGLCVDVSFDVPLLLDLPITFECQVTGEIRLGTHIMFLGEVRKIYIREDVTSDNPLCWYPWADVVTA